MEVSYHNKSTVTVSAIGVDELSYDAALAIADHILSHFKAKLYNTWGCDGIGYVIEKKRGVIRRNLSTVGPINYRKGLEAIKACPKCAGVLGNTQPS